MGAMLTRQAEGTPKLLGDCDLGTGGRETWHQRQ